MIVSFTLAKSSVPSVLAPPVAPTNVKAGFDVNSKEARLSWKSSLTDIEGFRVSRNNKYQ